MSVIDTLEVRLRADTSALTARLNAVAARLDALRTSSDAALTGLNTSARAGVSTQARLASRLNTTAKALKNVAANAKRAAKGIGLHKLDEINLAAQEKTKASGGGSRGGGSGAAADVQAELASLAERLKRLPEAFRGLWSNLKTFFRDLESAFAGIASGSFLGTAKRAGQGLLNGFVGAITDGRTKARDAAQSVTRAASFADSNAASAARAAGADLAQGFANGILSKLAQVRANAVSVANAAVSKLRSTLKIASPSKVTKEAGAFFGEGFAQGIVSTLALAEDSARRLSEGARVNLGAAGNVQMGASGVTASMRDAVREALGGTQLTVPLYVDGMKLGEASIRGINRVTRAAGKVMLEI